ncbi:hypothetical protein HF325_003448 [Metschnikowia pulcherrima]|uniref:G-patch domain-containing protein n=1 Tax=Metschnikowia pulcherrima TaxID=27326 RepID=A0A8H7GVI2_9ASCO|nr:hypothetical protein HF325_003448 [Metschnikowia pulcherrima]
MNASSYLQSFGWQEGQALQKGGLKKPILVKHKKDNKGLGSEVNDADMWWERLFDGQLKSLEVTSGSNGVSVKQNEKEVADHMRKANLPLYRMFVRGEGLAGTVGKTENALVKSITIEATEVFDNVTRSVDSLKLGKKEKSKKTSEKVKKVKKTIEDKKDKKDKKTREDKKDKKLKLETREKKEKSGKKEKEDKKEKRVSKEEKCLKEKKDQKDKKDKKDMKDKKSRKNKATELALVDKADKNAKKERKSKKRHLDNEQKPSKRSKTS